MKTFQSHLKQQSEVGGVQEIRPPLVWVDGLPSASIHEVVVFESNIRGLVTALTRDRIEVLLLSKEIPRVGEVVTSSGTHLTIPLGPQVAGKMLNSLGEVAGAVMDGHSSQERAVIEVRPRPIEHRRKIHSPLLTGVSVVDLMLPIGRGQRQLIVGDSKTAKGSFAQTVMKTQAELGTMVIYAAIGKRWGDIRSLQEFVAKLPVRDNIVLVTSFAHDPASLIWLTPYTAMTVAEWWVDVGRDALVIFDDLTTHAEIHREIALMGRRFPGRESYPGDIFYTHARLLERAGNFIHPQQGEIALSCLPIVEAVESSFTGHIVSNLISITDGHMLFEPRRFHEGQNPPVDIGLSVTRVGRQTQSKLAKKLHRELSALLAKYEKTKSLSHFGAELNEEAKHVLARGDILTAFFSQPTGMHGVSYAYSVQLVIAAMIAFEWTQAADAGAIQAWRDRLQAHYIADSKVSASLDFLTGVADLDQLKQHMETSREHLLSLCQAPSQAPTRAIAS